MRLQAVDRMLREAEATQYIYPTWQLGILLGLDITSGGPFRRGCGKTTPVYSGLCPIQGGRRARLTLKDGEAAWYYCATCGSANFRFSIRHHTSRTRLGEQPRASTQKAERGRCVVNVPTETKTHCQLPLRAWMGFISLQFGISHPRLTPSSGGFRACRRG